MTETREAYIIPTGKDPLSIFESQQRINIALASIANRLDKIEGIRGIPQTVQAPIMTDLTPTRLVGTNADKQLISKNLADMLAGAYVTITDDEDGTATISIPQSVATTGTPEFAGVNLPITEIEADYTVLATDGIVVANCWDTSTTAFLLHSNTTDGSTTFTDSSPSAHTLVVDSAIHKDDVKEFGSTGMFFNSASLITSADSDDFEFADGNFTIHFWVKGSGYGGSDANFILKLGYTTSSTSYTWEVARDAGDSGKIIFRYKSAGGDGTVTGTTALPNNGGFTVPDIPANTDMDHVAIVRNGTSLRIYVNGTLDIDHDISTKSITAASSAYRLMIGKRTSSVYFQGYLDEIHILKGTALWTANFTPPTAESFLPPSNKTITLPAGIEGRQYTFIKGDENTGTATIVDLGASTVLTLSLFKQFAKIRYANSGWIWQGDHGLLSGLSDDDHPQYIKDSEFTADSEILVGTGAGTFQKESGATLRTSIGVDEAGTVNYAQYLIATGEIVTLDSYDCLFVPNYIIEGTGELKIEDNAVLRVSG